MGCLLVMLGAFFPRLAVFWIWMARPALFDAAIGGLWAILGIIFLPFTTLTYVLLWSPTSAIGGTDWIWLGLAVLIDLVSAGTSAYGNRDRVPGYGG